MDKEKTIKAISYIAEYFYNFNEILPDEIQVLEPARELVGARPLPPDQVDYEDFIETVNEFLTATNWEGARFTVPRKEFNKDWQPWEFVFSPELPPEEDISYFLLVNEKEKKVCVIRVIYSAPPNYYIEKTAFFMD
ncbi:MAG: hypothetical protein COX51_01925 [Syntrophobacteraceae bacterium CG23_combo_of_CG06-09_8_20_14_all_50_8]|nr:MAG: hypothetical protein COX51_01925 [Syntrophobacteraceae bacterium CG23_combo_of_CG06-09_8_20_14_all_50_8]